MRILQALRTGLSHYCPKWLQSKPSSLPATIAARAKIVHHPRFGQYKVAVVTPEEFEALRQKNFMELIKKNAQKKS